MNVTMPTCDQVVVLSYGEKIAEGTPTEIVQVPAILKSTWEPRMLKVERINFTYGVQQALWDVSLQVKAGEFVALVGSNGAGKTTLMRILSGLLTPQTGKIQFRGRSLLNLPTHRICEMGVIHLPEGRMAGSITHLGKSLERRLKISSDCTWGAIWGKSKMYGIFV